MLSCNDFYRLCKKYNLTFFAGVPDSTYKSWMSFLEENQDKITNITTVNECEAVAVCTGYHLATGKAGVLYMQNSGFGKTINPLTSLCDPTVYNIPLLLMIGWRGEPDIHDAYQHHKMGRITLPLLELLGIPYEIISPDIKQVDKTLKHAIDYMQKNSSPFALVVRKNIFEKHEKQISQKNPHKMSRETALKIIMDNLNGDEVIISTTGKISRELFEYRSQLKTDYEHDFYNIGAMGCAQSIAFGIALQKKKKRTFVFDGDGAVLMQMGALATIGHYAPSNFHHIVFDNTAHDSTGGQPTCSNTVHFDQIAKACHYRFTETVHTKQMLENVIQKYAKKKGPIMIVVKVSKGARDDLGRPTMMPQQHKKNFMQCLQRK